MTEKSDFKMKDAFYWIEKLDLQPHPEGGYFKETFVSKDIIATEGLDRNYSGPRKAYTLIYYLLRSGQVSKFHRLKSDEIWVYHVGSALTIHVIQPDGNYVEKMLGPDIENGESFQHVVTSGCWFGASIDADGSYALVSCFVSPGFDFDDFEMGERDELIQNYPGLSNVIGKLMR